MQFPFPFFSDGLSNVGVIRRNCFVDVKYPFWPMECQPLEFPFASVDGDLNSNFVVRHPQPLGEFSEKILFINDFAMISFFHKNMKNLFFKFLF